MVSRAEARERLIFIKSKNVQKRIIGYWLKSAFLGFYTEGVISIKSAPITS